MPIDPAIRQRILDLGGSAPDGDLPLKEFLLGTSIPHDLYHDEWECYGLDKLLKKHGDLAQSDRDAFLKLVEKRYLVADGEPASQDFWRPDLFTPLTPGTKHNKEFAEWFDEEADLSVIRQRCGDGVLEFVHVIYSYGWPDQVYVCLQDPRPENPTLYETDHEEFFQEVLAGPTLLGKLNAYLTREEFLAKVNQEIDSELGD